MTQTDTPDIQRMKELIGILKRADTAYYKHDAPRHDRQGIRCSL